MGSPPMKAASNLAAAKLSPGAKPRSEAAQPRPARRLLARMPVTYRLGAGGAALVLAATAAYFAWPRQRFDMVATLAAFVQNEGTWDNLWDKSPEKVAEVKA